MTKPVDLDAIDKAHAAATPGAWVDYCWSDVVAITNGDCRAIATLHNAYPAMAAELRALREVAEAARVVLDAEANMSGVELSQEQIDALRAALAKVPR